jgi:dolichyl-phosphate-mannose-protein mannosyltransferase
VTVDALSWTPDLFRNSPDPAEIHNLNDVVYRQYAMFDYHSHVNATHPYSSKAWEWPLDYVPVAYFYEDHRIDRNDPNGCCVQEITSLPNPLSFWFGLIAVPIVGALAWLRRRKGYALIVVVYILQWAPWFLSPRIDFMYEFYVDVPLMCLCNAIVLQQVWRFGHGTKWNAWSTVTVCGITLAIVGAFIFFFPVLSAEPITWNAWHSRMWLPTWIIGPG